MSKRQTAIVCINDYGSGGIYFYKIEMGDDEDHTYLDEYVDSLMTLKDHWHKTCTWTSQSPEEIVDETHITITHEELMSVEEE
jgi:hypothetical protein